MTKSKIITDIHNKVIAELKKDLALLKMDLKHCKACGMEKGVDTVTEQIRSCKQSIQFEQGLYKRMKNNLK